MVKYSPTYSLKIDNKPIPESIAMRLLGWEYEDCEGLDKLTLTFDNYDLKMDKSIFQQGVSVEFRHGYLNPLDMSEPFIGMIDIKSGFRRLTIECIEIAYVFNTEERVRIFQNATLDEVVGRIACENNLAGYQTIERVDARGVALKFDYFQTKLQDLSFLYLIGIKIGYKVWVENEAAGQMLYFMPRKYWMTPYMTFTYYGEEGQMLDFEPQVNTRGKRGALEIGGVDLETKQSFIHKTAGASLTRKAVYLGEQFYDYDEIVSKYKVLTEKALVRQQVNTKAEAEDVLAGKYEEEMEHQITAELHLVGEPKLRSKRVIQMDNVDEYSGKYYVTHVKHSSDGYTTIAQLTRNAAFDEGERYARKNIDSVVNRNRPSVSEFLAMTKNSPKADYYKTLLR